MVTVVVWVTRAAAAGDGLDSAGMLRMASLSWFVGRWCWLRAGTQGHGEGWGPIALVYHRLPRWLGCRCDSY